MAELKEGELVLGVTGNREYMRFEPNGDIYVRGNKVATDLEVYEGFKAWLKAVQTPLMKEVPTKQPDTGFDQDDCG